MEVILFSNIGASIASIPIVVGNCPELGNGKIEGVEYFN